MLKQSFRAEDIIARIGGDEFGILLPETGAAELTEIVARLTRQIAEQPDSWFSLSMGWASAREHVSLMDLMHQADLQMYQEKKRRKEATSSQA